MSDLVLTNGQEVPDGIVSDSLTAAFATWQDNRGAPDESLIGPIDVLTRMVVSRQASSDFVLGYVQGQIAFPERVAAAQATAASE